MINPWVIVLVGIAWLGSLVGVGWWQRHDGAAGERVVWQERANTELASANAEILRLENQARTQEAKHTAALATISKRNLEEKQRVETQHQADIVAVRAGTLVLRDPGAATVDACASAAGTPGASAGGRDGGAGGQLSGAAAEFLLAEAERADVTARQLAAAQAVIVEDRRLCGVPP